MALVADKADVEEPARDALEAKPERFPDTAPPPDKTISPL